MVSLGEVIEFEQKSKRKSGDGQEKGLYKFFASSQNQSKFLDEADYIHENLILGTGGNASVHITQNFSTSADTFVFHSKINQLNNIFLYHLLLNNKEMLENGFRGQGIKHLSKEYLLKIKIPLPPLEIQEQIVAELDGYQKIIDGAKQIAQNWKPKIDIDPEWQKVKLGEICNLIQRGKSPVYGESNIQVIKSGQARGYYEFDFSKRYFTAKEFNLDHRKLQKGDLLINSTGIGTAGRITLFQLGGEFLADSHITIVRLKHEVGISNYVLYALDSVYGFKALEGMADGNGGQIELGLSKIRNLEIPLPPLEIQEQIVEKIEAERALVESAKKLINIYEQKTKEAIIKLWEE
jgi:type I restriction enzyme M protein